MDSAPGQGRSSARKAQWWGVLALFVGGPALGGLGVTAVVVCILVAVAAVWGSILLATEPPVVRRVPNLRGAIVLTGVVAALGLSLYAYDTWNGSGHAHAMESTVSSP